MRRIYLDYNATTLLLPAVWEAMLPCLRDGGNPASAHAVGRQARRYLEDARERVASHLEAHPDEVLFTSGATEANNLALFGQVDNPPAQLLSSPIEHPSVSEPLQQLSNAGFTVTYLPVDATGRVPADALRERDLAAVRLLTLMLVNHEIGTIQPVQELARLLPAGTACHCDAVQAVGKMPVSFRQLGVTTLSFSAHKFHGPTGVGVLLVRRGVMLRPRMFGGHQQGGRRPGTEPVALAVGLAAALDLACAEHEARRLRVARLRTRFLTLLQVRAAPVVVNGSADGVPHTLNLSFPGLRADLLLMALDLAGVACSAGSACSSGSLLPSPVLRAMGLPEEGLRSAVRFSLGYLLEDDEIDDAAERVATAVCRMRESGDRGWKAARLDDAAPAGRCGIAGPAPEG
jgi:cysteine desulfurase